MTDEKLIARLREIQGQAGLFASAAADRIEALLARAEAAEARAERLEEALIWCSGSADFAEGGLAREGWLTLCAPLLKEDALPAVTPAPDAAAIREAALLAAWTAVYEAKTLLDAKNAVHALITEKPHDRA